MTHFSHRPTARNIDPSADPMAPSDYAIRAILDGLDHLALDMERKWGVDRLRLLVADPLRARFDAQKDKLDAAVVANEERYVRAQAEGMKRAWAVLGKAAIEAGARPLSPEVWECALPSSGTVVAIVRSSAEARHLAGERVVFSLEEVARLIDNLPAAVLETKRVFPGAEVARVGPPEIDWERGDDIPF